MPATFVGGGRYEMERFQDCFGLTRTYGKPALFITLKCNPKWPEITRALYEGQIPTDRPDIISRVFNARSRLFNKSIRGPSGVFGPAGPYFDAVEFQKREFPHTHTVLWLDRVIRTAQDVDEFVCAEMPEVYGPYYEWGRRSELAKNFSKKNKPQMHAYGRREIAAIYQGSRNAREAVDKRPWNVIAPANGELIGANQSEASVHDRQDA